MPALKSLDDLYLHTLKDILYAERQIEKCLPKMARKATEPKVKEAFEAQRETTEKNIARIEIAFDKLEKAPRGTKCEAIMGIIGEAEELMDEATDDTTRDAAMISAVQAMHHYEMTRFGTLASWSNLLGHSDVAKEMADNMDAAEKADKKLNKLAESRVNKKAA